MKKNTLLGFMPSSLALAILSVIQPACAEDNVLPTITLTAANSQSDGDVPTTTQSLKSEQPLFKTAKSVSVVTKEQIEKNKP